MNLILVSIGNFQSYILDNNKQLLRLNIKNIYVITEEEFFIHFENYKDTINLINVSELNEHYNFYNKTHLNKDFRNGFWTFASLRFFYIYSLMEKYNLSNCVHIENDVLLYYNIDLLENKLNKNYLYIPFDSYTRNIASIMYIPNSQIFKNILDNYDVKKNDMENFSNIKCKTNLIQNLPIFSNKYINNEEEAFVCENYDVFNIIFDAASMGQYLGGVDPRNIQGDTTGFVNETCVIKYNKYNFIWETHESVKKPFLEFEHNHMIIKIPIFNLHIHSKNLFKFM